MYSYEKIAKILHADKKTIKRVEEKMAGVLGHNSVFDKIVEENEAIIKEKIKFLKIKENSAASLYKSLINKIKDTDYKIFNLFERPVCDKKEGCEKVLNFAKELSGSPDGFFLKEEKAKELLINIPPQNVLKFLKYKNAEEMLARENLFEVFAALRFIEESSWLNNIFFKQYENLKPSDFEKRKIRVEVLSDKWRAAAENFLKKKYHNISHLKELGVIFIIPALLDVPGETLRTFSLILHYFHEIDF